MAEFLRLVLKRHVSLRVVPNVDSLLIKNTCRGLTRTRGSAAKLPKGSEKAKTLCCLLT